MKIAYIYIYILSVTKLTDSFESILIFNLYILYLQFLYIHNVYEIFKKPVYMYIYTCVWKLYLLYIWCIYTCYIYTFCIYHICII